MFPHDTIFGPVFWIAMGLIYGLIIVSARIWAQDLGLKMTWWKWTLATVWYLFLSIGVAAGTTFWGEGEIRAGWYVLGITVTVAIILGAGLARLIWMGRSKQVKTAKD